jgi:hypothetical protein
MPSSVHEKKRSRLEGTGTEVTKRKHVPAPSNEREYSWFYLPSAGSPGEHDFLLISCFVSKSKIREIRLIIFNPVKLTRDV